jgi:hypothetical protein
MMTAEDIRRQLAAYTYRPGWSFELLEGHLEGLRVRIVGTVEDAYRPGEHIDLGINVWLGPMDSPAALDRWLAYRRGRVELHESREWLRRDGRHVDDPHAETWGATE